MQRVERTDADLVAASRRGDRAAFERLVERHRGLVGAVAHDLTRDRTSSEDVTQETFLAAWRQLPQLREVERLPGWLCGIARNLARKTRRRLEREALVDQPRVAGGTSPFEAASSGEAETIVRDALAGIPEPYRETLVLYYHDDRSAREVADLLNISEAAVLKRLIRGRQHLARGVAERVGRAPDSRRNLGIGALAAFDPSAGAASASTTSMLKVVVAGVATAAAAGAIAYAVHGSSPRELSSAVPV